MVSSLILGDTDDIGNAGSIGGVVSIEEWPVLYQDTSFTLLPLHPVNEYSPCE